MDLKELEIGIDPQTHWYYQSKKLPLLQFAGRFIHADHPLTIVDVGAGSGFFALELERHYGSAIAKVYLVDIAYTEEEINATKGEKIEKVHHIPDRIAHSLVLLMDVLEHLEDDGHMLHTIRQACTGDNNHFFITVPAFSSLWSGHDVFLGHYRRYRKASLQRVLKAAGFRDIHCFYLYGLLFPAVWIVRRLSALQKNKTATSDMRPFSKKINRFLLALTALEMKGTRANQFFGLTCAAEGRI